MLETLWYALFLLIQVGLPDPAFQKSTVYFDVYRAGAPVYRIALQGSASAYKFTDIPSKSLLGDASLLNAAERSYLLRSRIQDSEAEAAKSTNAVPFVIDLAKLVKNLVLPELGASLLIPVPELVKEDTEQTKETKAVDTKAAETKSADTKAANAKDKPAEAEKKEEAKPEFLLQNRGSFWVLSAGFDDLLVIMSKQ